MTDSHADDPLALKGETEAASKAVPERHRYRRRVLCDTDSRGHKTPKGKSPVELVVDASEGFIPLWSRNSTLRWRFRESSMTAFKNPTAAKAAIRKLLGKALVGWGAAAPVKFAERVDAWDFEIVMRKADECEAGGCVLASAFFPDAGRHKLNLYPKMFEQTEKEQIETLEHEIGHTFGLRHFFAQITSESQFPSEIFGKHVKFSIMNYGSDSVLTEQDRKDLTNLYQAAWSGSLGAINGTPIKFVKPFHTTGGFP